MKSENAITDQEIYWIEQAIDRCVQAGNKEIGVYVRPAIEKLKRKREPKVMNGEWNQYQRKGISEMRPYIQNEDLSGVSVNPVDTPEIGGMVARNPKNHADQWYVARQYFEDNLELVTATPPEQMNEQKAREVLGDWINKDDSLSELKIGFHVAWFPCVEPETCILNGDFTAEQLKAVAWWMENKGINKL